MRLILLGGLIIVMPALAVVWFLWGSTVVFPALGSVFVAILPFVAFLAILGRMHPAAGEADH